MLILDLRKLETIADYFVICTGDVDQHVRAIVDNIEKHVKTDLGERVFHREGTDALNWVLLDYVDVVVHVFKPSFREFYRLEDLWGDADLIPVSDDVAVAPRPKPSRRRVAVPAPVEAEAAAPKKTRARKPAAKKAAVKKAAPKAATKTIRKTAVKKTPRALASKSAPAKAPTLRRPRKSEQ